MTHFEPDAGLAEEVVLWHCAVLEDDVAGGGGADAELVLLLAERESWGRFKTFSKGTSLNLSQIMFGV